MNCPKCGRAIAANSRFCGTCGTALDAAAAGAAAAPTAQTSAPGVGAAAATGPAFAPLSSGAAAGLFERFKNILLAPKQEWPVIAAESTSAAEVSLGYLLPLTAVVAVLSLVRISLIGTRLPFGETIRPPLAVGLETAAMTFVAAFIGVWLVALIVNVLAPTFGGTRNLNKAFKVAVYAMTPAYAASVLAFSPILPTLLEFVAGLYGIYVLYLGLPVVMRSPPERAVGYTATVIVCTILLGIVLEFAFFGMFLGTRGLGATTGLMGARSADPADAAQQGAAEAGDAIGSVLGTDAKGKAGLTAALSNLVKAGEQNAAQTGAAGNGGTSQAGTTQPDAASTQNAAQNPAAAVGGLMAAVGGALGGDHPVAVADFKSLTAILPAALPGLKRTDARGATQGAMGIKTASATGTYRNDSGATVQIEITDMSGVSGLMGMADALVQTTTSQSDTGFEKDVVINGRTVHEKYDTPGRHGEISVLLVKRYHVDVTGDGMDMAALEQSFGQIDLGRLEAMKDVGSNAK